MKSKKKIPFWKKIRPRFSLTKRQKFVIDIIILTAGLLASELLLGKSGFFVSFVLAILTDVLFYFSNYKDMRENFSWNIFILPFFYTLSFALFFFIVPARFTVRIIMTLFYGVGLYSLFLAQNIFTVAAVRTIALVQSARIVSFVITLISCFFLANIVYTLHFSILPASVLLFSFTFFLVLQSLWTITLEKSIQNYLIWSLGLTICLFEISLVLWFWPSTPTIISLFLTGFFYTIVGLSQVWFSKRLFRGVMWEYIWVGVGVLMILVLFTPWGR